MLSSSRHNKWTLQPMNIGYHAICKVSYFLIKTCTFNLNLLKIHITWIYLHHDEFPQKIRVSILFISWQLCEYSSKLPLEFVIRMLWYFPSALWFISKVARGGKLWSLYSRQKWFTFASWQTPLSTIYMNITGLAYMWWHDCNVVVFCSYETSYQSSTCTNMTIYSVRKKIKVKLDRKPLYIMWI